MPEWVAGLSLAAILSAGVATPALAADHESKLAGEAARAERILIGIPEKKGVATGKTIDVPPGDKFLIEIQRALRGTGRKAAQALIVNSGDEKQHPKFIAGKPYLFLLKKDVDGKRWVSLGVSEIPIRDGKVQWLAGGKVVEQIGIDEFDELVSKDAPVVAEELPARDTLTGNWIIVLSESGADAHLWLVELTPDEKEGRAARLISSSPRLTATALRSSSIAGDQVRLSFDADGAIVDFQGRFQNGVVLGNAVTGRESIVTARIVPTEVRNLRQYEDPVPDPARGEWLDAAGQEEAFGPLSRFVRRHPESPLTIPACRELISLAQSQGYDRAKFEKLAGEYLHLAGRWGPRMELRAKIDLGLLLSRHEFLPELALEYLTAADRSFDGETPAPWKQTVGIERGKRLIAGGKAPEGIDLLTHIREEYPFEPDVIYALARQAEKEKRSDDALALYGEIATLPLVESALLESLKASGRKPSRDEYPSRVMTRLWTEKHGDREGLADWLASLYESRIQSIAGEKRPPRREQEGTRVVLCELFTNGDCEPCVAADVALTALEATYASSEVITLRYHQQKPGPDPLANDDSTERFTQYQCTTTPTLIVNGRRFPAGGGPLSVAPLLYRALRSYIDPLLEAKIDLRLEASARADQGKVMISAKAAGLKEFPPNARMMVVLAEKKIDCPMRNGIRSHQMIVRTLPAGLAGISAAKGELAYQDKIDLEKLKRRLAQQLAATERENLVEFDDKPLDLKSLQLVVLLQNSETGEVLQAAVVPVTGSDSGAAGTKPAVPPGAAKKPASGGN
jgi:hypothetical protein